MPTNRSPVVLLHGCGGSAHDSFVATGWVDAIERTGRSVLAPDLPGHGTGSHSHDAADYADLAGMLQLKLPVDGFDLVAFSLGAKLALEMMLRIPQRIGRAVLGGIGDNAFAPEAVASAAIAALISGPTAAMPAPVREFLQEWNPARNDALAVVAVLRRPANPVFTADRLRQITAPLLIVNGGDDPVGQRCGALAAALPQAQVVSIPGVGHFGLPRHPLFRQQALAFLALSAVAL
jgi:pimeloyl-ACP methyl ester carboxylesterase